MKTTPEERKNRSEAKLIELGISCNAWLPAIEDSTQVKCKDLDTICRRAIACLVATQVACDIEKGDYELSCDIFRGLLRRYGVEDALNPMEKRLFDGTYSQQDVINAAWEYETYWAVVWALGLVEDISDGGTMCDCQKAIQFIAESASYDAFKENCRLRDTEEILDMLDLYYRYHWAVTHKRINPETNIGSLHPGIVVERRRGLEWLFASETDWYDISLDT